ncbi:MAG: Zn-ribbon containing protein [Haloarculaceae archaeon]
MPHQCTTCGHVFPDGSKEMLSGCPECGGNAFQFHPEGADIPEEPPDADPPAGDEEVTGTVGRAASTVRNLVGSDADEDAPAADGDAPAAAATAGDEADAASPRSDAPWPDQEDDDGDIIVAEETDPDGEDAAQASARSDLAAPEDLSEGAADVAATDATGTSADDATGTSADDATGTSADDATDAPGVDPLATAGDGPPAPDDGRVVSEPTEEEGPDLAELREQLNDQFESIKIVEPGEYELNLMELFDREEYIIALRENGRYVIQVPEQWLGDRDVD